MPDRRANWSKRFAGVALSIALVVGGTCLTTPSETPIAQALPAKASISEQVEALAKRMAKKPERLWVYAYEISALAAKDTSKRAQIAAAVSGLFDHDDAGVRLAASAITLSLGESGEALFEDAEIAAMEIISEGEQALYAQAARTLVALAAEDTEGVIDAIDAALEDTSSLDPEAHVALIEARYEFLEDDADRASEIESLVELSTSDNADLARHAALALARNGEFSQVAAQIAEIASGAGELAGYARILLENAETKAEIKSVSSNTNDVVSETLQAVLSGYHGKTFHYSGDDMPLSVDNLLDNAYRGMANSLDPYSTVYTSKEFKKMSEGLGNSYAGIGAYVGKGEDDEAIVISQPIYSGPAFRAGLRSGDMIWQAQIDDGEVIPMKGVSVADGIKILKGPPGTKIKLWVKRPGVKDLVPLELERARVRTNPCPFNMMPGNLGYVRLNSFGDNYTIQRFFVAFRELALVEKANGIVLDLRGNPGGVVRTVVFIAGLMLPRRSKVVSAMGIFPPFDDGGIVHRSSVKTPFFKDTPLVVLIDGESASGSEILSATLQDHKRATVIGEASYGKGIGQSFYPITEEEVFTEEGQPSREPLDAALEKESGRILKTTVFDYYIMPSGRSIDKYSSTPSVRPDIEVHNPLLSSWEARQVLALRKTEKLDTWVRETWDKHIDIYMAIADSDGYSEASYPDFDKLYESLDTQLSKDRVRKMLRVVVRRLVTDERAERYFKKIDTLPPKDRENAEFRGEFLYDYQVDVQLQRAIIELAKQTKTDLSDVKEYAPFVSK